MTNNHSSTTLTIDLGAIATNYSIIKNKVDGEVAAVVKADSYGLGMDKVAPRLYKEGCRKFFVVSLDEGLELRALLPDCEISVLYGVAVGQEEYFTRYNLTPVLNTLEQVRIWQQYTVKQAKKLVGALHFNTGMNRLGMDYKEIKGLDWSGIDISMVSSHLACADINNHKKNAEQLEQFKAIAALFPNVPLSLANSSGIFIGNDYHFDIVRPGAALYGINPVSGQKNPMKNVVRLSSKILQIRTIDTTATVGYGASCEVRAGTKIATIPVGYADGYLSYLGNKGHCFINGQKFAVVGRVSMDLITVDVTSYEGDLFAGADVELIGDNITVDDVAAAAGTIGYEILTSLGNRYKRVYTN